MRKVICYLILICISYTNILDAQQKIVLSKSFQKDYHISNYVTVTTNLSIDSFMILNKDLFKLGVHDNIVLDFSEMDKYGWEHKKYNIYHKGIKVEKQNINVQKNANELIYIGQLVENLDLDTTSLLDIAIIKDSLSKKLGYAVTSNNSQIRKAIINRYADIDNKLSTMRIIYVVEVQGAEQFSSTKIFNIDARNGEILYEYKDECNTLVSCPTVHYGNRTIQTKPQSYINALNTNICSSNIFVENNFETNGTTAPNFNIDDTLNQKRIFALSNGLNPNQYWIFGEANRLSNDVLRASIQRTLNEAQYLTRNSLDMFKSKFNESNDLLGEVALLKTCLANGREVDAFQNKSAFIITAPLYPPPFSTVIKNGNLIELGRCANYFIQNNLKLFNYTNDYMVGTDIIAHEITHNLVNKYAKLNMMLESGALAESYCDIFGYYFETWMNRNNITAKTPSWTVGDEVSIPTYNSILRNNPNPLALFTRSMNQPEIYTDPSFYKGSFYKNPNCCIPHDSNDYCWIHSHNSINNRWFFLCVNGMTNNSNPPIHIDTLMNIVYDNLKFNLSPNATLLQARRGSLMSLKKIYGKDTVGYKIMLKTIENAWDSVGVFDNDQLIFTLNTIPGENRIGYGTYYVYNDVVIPTGHHVRIENATLYFDENRKIKTEIGGCLYVKNSKLTSMNFGCFAFENPFYWRGIEMEGYSDGYKNYNLFLNNFNNGFDNVGTTQKDFRSNSSLIMGLNIYNSEISYADTAVKSGKYVFFDDVIPNNAALADKKQTGCDINIYKGNFFNNKKDLFYVLDNDRPTFVRVYNSRFHVDNGIYQRDYLKGSKIEIMPDNRTLNQNSIKDYNKQSINDWIMDILNNDKARINFQMDTFNYPSSEGNDIIIPTNLNKVIYTKLHNKYRSFGQFQSLAIENCAFTGSRVGIEAINTPSIRVTGSKFDSVDFPIYASGYKNISLKDDSFSYSFIPVKLNNYNELPMSRDKQDSIYFYSEIINNKFYYSGYREVEAVATRNIEISSNKIVNRYNRLTQDLAKNYLNITKVAEGVNDIKEYAAINLQHCKKSTISNNTFGHEGNHPLVWFYTNPVKQRLDTMPLYYTAIAITNNKNTNDFIYKNTIKDGWDIGVNSYGLNTGLRIKCNSFGTTNNPFNVAAIYTKGNLRWQGCTDAFIQNPTANYPCNNENDPAANTFSWNACTMPDEAKLYLDTTATVSFQYYTQSVDGTLSPTPYVDNRASSYCLNTPRNIPRTSVNNCGSGTNGYKIMPNTCNEDNILSGKLIPYSENDNGGKVPICTNWDRLYVDKSILVGQLNELRLNTNYKTGLENISKDMVLYNIKNEIAATDFELYSHAERCRDTLKLDTLKANANSLNIKLDRLREQVLSKNNSTAESIASLQGQIQADNDLPAKIKTFYTQELDQYQVLNRIGNSGSTEAAEWSSLINSPQTEAQVIARQWYAEKNNIVLPCLLPTIDMTENDIRMQYLTDNLAVNNNYIFEMYPNPVSDVLEYRCQLNPEILNAKVTLFNVSYPASYLVDKTIEERGSIVDNMDVSMYAQGNYILTLWINGVPKKSYMVIKQ